MIFFVLANANGLTGYVISIWFGFSENFGCFLTGNEESERFIENRYYIDLIL